MCWKKFTTSNGDVMSSLVKAVELEDYLEIQDGVQMVQETVRSLVREGAKLHVYHPHRFWEYASAIQALLSLYGAEVRHKAVLDVGSGFGPLGPTLSYKLGVQVMECEPGRQERMSRLVTNKILE